MDNFTDLKRLIERDMDTRVMSCSYDYAFAADRVTLTFHAAKDSTDVIKCLIWENASHRMGDIIADTGNFLRQGVEPTPVPSIRSKEAIKFLDYKIGQSGNDGIILLKERTDGLNYESHLGYYSSVDDAQRAAVLYFMLRRPDQFASELCSIISDRARAADLPVDYYRFAHAVKDAGLAMPEELTDGGGKPVRCKSKDNATYDGIHLYYKGEPFVGFM